MTPLQVDEILKNHRVTSARLARLQSELTMLQRHLAMCKARIVNDSISLSQAITGMPHGSNTSDPTGRLAADLASGEATPFVKELIRDIEKTQREIREVEPKVRAVEIILQALLDREREVLVLKIIDDRDWGDTLEQMNQMHNNSYSKRTLQRLLDRALVKAYEIAK